MKKVISKLNEIVGSWKFLALYFLTIVLITFILQVPYTTDYLSFFGYFLIIAPLWGFQMVRLAWLDSYLLQVSIFMYGIMVISLFYIAFKRRYRKIVAWIFLTYLTVSLIRAIIEVSPGLSS